MNGAFIGVWGVGGVGQNIVAGARLALAEEIVAVDPSEERLAMARARGATVIRAPADAARAIERATGGHGLDVAFEAVGEPAVMAGAIETLGVGGELVLIGAAARDAGLTFAPRRFMSRQQRITGCIYGSIRPRPDLRTLLRLCANGTLSQKDLLGETRSLEDLPELFASPATTASSDSGDLRVTAVRYSEATPDELASAIASCPALLMPIGTLEDHGNHLPLGLDGLKAEAIAHEAAARLGAVLAAPNWWAADGVARPYTLRLPARLLEPLLVEALVQFAGFGFSVVVLVSGHFGLENSRLIRRVALGAMACVDATVVPISDYEVLLDLGDLGDRCRTMGVVPSARRPPGTGAARRDPSGPLGRRRCRRRPARRQRGRGAPGDLPTRPSASESLPDVLSTSATALTRDTALRSSRPS